MDIDLYRYKAVVRSVYDGDTCTVDIDLGLKTWIHGEKLRLYRIDAPEVRGAAREAGLRARDFLRSQIDDKEIYIQTIKDRKGKYGRYLAEIWLEDENGGAVNVNDLMVAQGHAVYREY
jgi:micrococcal nuclease